MPVNSFLFRPFYSNFNRARLGKQRGWRGRNNSKAIYFRFGDL